MESLAKRKEAAERQQRRQIIETIFKFHAQFSLKLPTPLRPTPRCLGEDALLGKFFTEESFSVKSAAYTIVQPKTNRFECLQWSTSISTGNSSLIRESSMKTFHENSQIVWLNRTFRMHSISPFRSINCEIKFEFVNSNAL